MPSVSDDRAIDLLEARAAWPDAFGLAYALSGDRAFAEDVCQEAFLRLWRQERPMDRSRPLRPLILHVVRNLCISAGRRREPVSLELALQAVNEPRSIGTASPPDVAIRREECAVVRERMGELPASWREAVYLRDGLGLSTKETAAVMETSEAVVRVTLHRARIRLRAMLGGLIQEITE